MLGLRHLRARQCISIRQYWVIIVAAGLGYAEHHVTKDYRTLKFQRNAT